MCLLGVQHNYLYHHSKWIAFKENLVIGSKTKNTRITDNFLNSFISPLHNEIGVDLNCELPVIDLEDLKVIETDLDLCWGLPCNIKRAPSSNFC